MWRAHSNLYGNASCLYVARNEIYLPWETRHGSTFASRSGTFQARSTSIHRSMRQRAGSRVHLRLRSFIPEHKRHVVVLKHAKAVEHSWRRCQHLISDYVRVY